MATSSSERVLEESFENLNLEEWELVLETKGMKIYRKIRQDSKLYEYRVYGTIEKIPPEIFLQVYMDLDYRKSWDCYVKELYEVNEGKEKIIYWEVKYPFPLSSRDYLYQREVKEKEKDGKKFYVVMAKSALSNAVVKKKNVVRVTDYVQILVVTSDDENGTKVYMEYFDNPGGMIPSWLINWACKTGVPDFLKNMEKACKGYEDYRRKERKY